MKLKRIVAVGGIAVLLGALPWVSGCGDGSKTAGADGAKAAGGTAGSGTSASPAAVARPMGDADLLAGVPLGAGGTNQEVSAAEQAWMGLLMAMRPPQEPAEWATNAPAKEAISAFRKKVGESAAGTAKLAEEFYTKYPKHEKAAEAKERELYLLNAAVQLGFTNVEARLSTIEAAKLKDPGLSDDDRFQLRVQQVQRTAFRMGGEDTKVVLAELEKGVRAVQKEFPKRSEAFGMLLGIAEGWMERSDIEKAKTLATEVSGAGGDEEIKTAAQAILKKIDRIGKPLEIKYTGIDGRSVDLQSMKGKVVLVDFWATWCGPCVQELPGLKAAYEKLHVKGFEIVGISLDHEKEALVEFVKKESMPWPQFFDEASERNRLAEEFQVTGIPTLWLVDKKGILRDLNGRDDLVAKVEKLLAE